MAESDDLRQFIRETIARHERVLRDQSRVFEHIIRKSDENTRALREVTDELRDTRDERRAHTAALWTLIDRLNNGGAQA